MTQDRVGELLSAWQGRHAAGETITPEELCQGAPELLAELRNRIDAIQFAERLRDTQPPSNAEAVTGTLSDGRMASLDGAANTSRLGEGGIIGDYQLLRELAAGGMGVVYKAQQRSLNRVVALKMLLPGRLTSEVGRARFRTEAEATAELDHPNIVPIFEVGEHVGCPFFTMKLIEGGTLGDLLRKLPRVPLRDLVIVIAKVCRAVHYAHQRGILHRDLKPSNVLLGTAGEPYVADFGLAKRIGVADGLTASGALLGTPAYMAPEQAGETGHAVTTLTDVYALGAVLYETLTGRPPFASRDLIELLAQIRSETPPPPSNLDREVPRDLELVCLKCLAKTPADRYSSAAELANDLERWLGGEPVEVRAPGTFARVKAWVRRNSQAAMWVVLIGVVWGMFGPQLPLSLTLLGPLLGTAVPGSLAHTVTLLPVPLVHGLFALASILHLSVGAVTYRVTKSADRSSHIVGGAGVGLIAGLAIYTLYVGPTTVLALSLPPLLATIDALEPQTSGSVGATHPTNATTNVQARPALLDSPPRDEFGARAKVVNALVRGVYQGLILGMVVTLVYTIPVAVGGSEVARRIATQRLVPVAAFLVYVEVTFGVSVGWLELVLLIAPVVWPAVPADSYLGFLSASLLIAMPIWCVAQGRGVRERWRLYGLGFLLSLLEGFAGTLPAIAIALAAVMGAILLLRGRPRQPGLNAFHGETFANSPSKGEDALGITLPASSEPTP